MRFGIFTTLVATLLFPAFAFAQSVGDTATFTISATPQYPAPMSSVALSFLSSSLDLTNATMNVSVNGTQIYTGNVQTVSIPLGKAGKAASVVAKITTLGTTYTESLTLQPQDVALIAEPVSSAPVLYPGKPLIPLGGKTRVVAVANFVDAGGKLLDPTTLSYTWTVDGAQIANSSGIGKSSIIVASPLQYRERAVSVSIQNQTRGLAGGASLSLAPKESSLRIYENDPLLGIRYEHALSDSYAIKGTETSLYAAPFSYSLSNGIPVLRWFLNGATAQTGSILTLRPSGSGQGKASLSLTASSEAAATVTTNLSLTFGTAPSTNLFGL